MREFFDRLNLRIAEFMDGRYGLDNLNKFLLVIAFILLIVGPFISPMDMVGWVFAILALVRALSRKHDRRISENEVYLKISRAPKKFFTTRATHWKNRKTKKYFKCNDCKQRLSVPRVNHKIRVICPKCGKEIFIKP